MKRLAILVAAGSLVTVPVASAIADERREATVDTTLVDAVRNATQAFRDVDQAIAAGYGSSGSCVSGPQEGAMGVHFPNGLLVEDPALDPGRPEILVYEQRGERLHLLGVEFLVIADAWNTAHPEGPPVLMGQHFNLVGEPNRYGLPAFYELHVWAWKDNPLGTFADYNSTVSCDEFSADDAHAHAGN